MDNRTVPLFQKQRYNENQNQGITGTTVSVCIRKIISDIAEMLYFALIENLDKTTKSIVLTGTFR